MFIIIDRFVLSQVEKATQFLQRYFGIKISTISTFFAGTAVICSFLDWHFTGIPNAFFLAVHCIVIFILLGYIIFGSKWHQKQAEARAARGVSNPHKILFPTMAIRLIYFFISILPPLFFIFSGTKPLVYTGLTYVFSFWLFVCTYSVDILPPSDSKAGAWFRNLFRKRSLST